MKIALVTGGLGFIGSNLVKILLKKKIVQKCILLDSYAGFVNPLKENFSDLRKYRFILVLRINVIIKLIKRIRNYYSATTRTSGNIYYDLV